MDEFTQQYQISDQKLTDYKAKLQATTTASEMATLFVDSCLIDFDFSRNSQKALLESMYRLLALEYNPPDKLEENIEQAVKAHYFKSCKGCNGISAFKHYSCIAYREVVPTPDSVGNFCNNLREFCDDYTKYILNSFVKVNPVTSSKIACVDNAIFMNRQDFEQLSRDQNRIYVKVSSDHCREYIYPARASKKVERGTVLVNAALKYQLGDSFHLSRMRVDNDYYENPARCRCFKKLYLKVVYMDEPKALKEFHNFGARDRLNIRYSCQGLPLFSGQIIGYQNIGMRVTSPEDFRNGFGFIDKNTEIIIDDPARRKWEDDAYDYFLKTRQYFGLDYYCIIHGKSTHCEDCKAELGLEQSTNSEQTSKE